MSKKQFELEKTQDNFLHNLQANGQTCTIITTNGVHINGTIEGFDRHVIIIQTTLEKQNMINKKAVSTIISN